MADKTVEIGGHESVLKDMSEEQLSEIKQKSVDLSMTPEVNLIVTAGISACRLYVVARLALRNVLVEKGYKWEDGFEEMFLKVIEDKSHEPFAMEELMEQLQAHVLIFMEEQIGSTNDEKETDDGEADTED
jgi:hypothetical protein